ncbi:MAG: DUF302 domain-containing protein [Deltaproteobacteria bacterium]|nr:DUF302 domain-containing protein [Deltaproteobacteria bacterium]
MKKTPLEKLKEKERKARQKIIVDAAEQVFAAKPFSKVSMRDISRESQVSLSSIYRYFPDQESLFLAALMRGAGKAELMIKKLVSREDISVDTVACAFIDYLVKHDQYFRMMTHFMLDGVLNPASIEKLNKMERALLDQFDNLFKKLNPQSNSRILSHAFFASLNGILITYRNYPGRDIKDIHKHMQQLGSVISQMFSGIIAQERYHMKYIVETDKSVDQAVRDLQEAVKKNNFGVLHIHNLKETLKQKGVDFPNECQILEICNPQKAKQVLTDDMSMNMALPCRISVYSEDGKTKIGMIRPKALLEYLSVSDSLKGVAQEVETATMQMIEQAK